MKWLRTSSSRVVTEDEEPVILRGVGVGVGGWLNMENFITGYPATETAHRDAMRKALGQERYEMFFGSFLTHFFGADDAAYLATLGMNCVRIPVNYRHSEDDATPGELNQKGFQHLDRAIDACASQGIYTVIDLHAAPGAADGGPYPGETASRDTVDAEFQNLTTYTREHEVPAWVGEFGPVYGAGRERDAQRSRLLAGQIEI